MRLNKGTRDIRRAPKEGGCVANGYATQADRRNAALIRQRQNDGCEVTKEQVVFAENVERIIAKEKATGDGPESLKELFRF